MRRGEAITEDSAREWLGYIGLVCRPGETVTLLALIARPGFRPKFNAFAVTNQRVMTVTMKNLAKQGPTALELGDIARIEVASRGVGSIILADRGGQRYLFGQLAHDSDIGMICQHLTALAPWAEVVESPTKTTHSFLGTATTSTDGLGSRLKSAFNGEQTHQSRESPQEEPAATAEAAPPPDGFVTYGSQPAPDPRPQFDASRPPKPGDPVPADCVWAIRQHPGPMPGRATFGNHAKTNAHHGRSDRANRSGDRVRARPTTKPQRHRRGRQLHAAVATRLELVLQLALRAPIRPLRGLRRDHPRVAGPLTLGERAS